MLVLVEVNNYKVLISGIYRQNTESFLYVCDIRDTGIMVSYELHITC
jgi:hypothetical protein